MKIFSRTFDVGGQIRNFFEKNKSKFHEKEVLSEENLLIEERLEKKIL